MLRFASRATTATRAASPAAAFRRLNSTSAASAVVELGDLKQFQAFVAEKSKLSVVDFYATWCGPCKAIAPIFDAFSVKIPEVQFSRVDVDRAEDVARECGITAMPTILFYQDGKKLDTVVGANVPQMVQLIKQHSGVDARQR